MRSLEATPPTTEKDQQIERLIKRLGGTSYDRESAECTLVNMGPEVVEPLLVALKKEVLQRNWRQCCQVALLLGLAALILVRYLHQGVTDYTWTRMILIVSTMLSLSRATNRQKGIVHVLATMDNLQIVGPLAEGLAFTHGLDGSVVKAASIGLIRLLPRLRASDASMLTNSQYECLHKALAGRNRTLKLAILQALEQIGDSRALPYVEKLARNASEYDPGVAEAARHCLLYLHAAAENERASETLLRPTGAPTAQPAHLLRPSHSDPEVREELLLRASEAPNDTAS